VEAGFSLNGEPLCAECATAAVAARLVDLEGSSALDHEIVVERRQPQRPHTERKRVRSRAREAAERRAMSKLKLLHLSEYQTILGEELRADGQTPPRVRPLDVHLRHLMSHRLLALARRA
jgi:hypothetical protein